MLADILPIACSRAMKEDIAASVLLSKSHPNSQGKDHCSACQQSSQQLQLAHAAAMSLTCLVTIMLRQYLWAKPPRMCSCDEYKSETLCGDHSTLIKQIKRAVEPTGEYQPPILLLYNLHLKECHRQHPHQKESAVSL